jgi:hypothetical protein
VRHIARPRTFSDTGRRGDCSGTAALAAAGIAPEPSAAGSIMTVQLDAEAPEASSPRFAGTAVRRYAGTAANSGDP